MSAPEDPRELDPETMRTAVHGASAELGRRGYIFRRDDDIPAALEASGLPAQLSSMEERAKAAEAKVECLARELGAREASEWPGVVEGWKRRAIAAEAERDGMEERAKKAEADRDSFIREMATILGPGKTPSGVGRIEWWIGRVGGALTELEAARDAALTDLVASEERVEELERHAGIGKRHFDDLAEERDAALTRAQEAEAELDELRQKVQRAVARAYDEGLNDGREQVQCNHEKRPRTVDAAGGMAREIGAPMQDDPTRVDSLILRNVILRIYDPIECDEQGVPLDWERCRACGGELRIRAVCSVCAGAGSLKAAALAEAVEGPKSGKWHVNTVTGERFYAYTEPIRPNPELCCKDCDQQHSLVRALGWPHDLRPEKLAVLCLRCFAERTLAHPTGGSS
jgi:hypothetical protein